MKHSCIHSRRGLSLLEVILALAILGGALATVSQLYRIGAQQAMAARDMTIAQMWCESKLAEITAGAIAPESIEQAPLDEEGEFLYSVVAEPMGEQGLISVMVTVEMVPPLQGISTLRPPLSFSLTRWMVDPEVQAAAEAQAAADALLLAEQRATEKLAPAQAGDAQDDALGGIGGGAGFGGGIGGPDGDAQGGQNGTDDGGFGGPPGFGNGPPGGPNGQGPGGGRGGPGGERGGGRGDGSLLPPGINPQQPDGQRPNFPPGVGPGGGRGGFGGGGNGGPGGGGRGGGFGGGQGGGGFGGGGNGGPGGFGGGRGGGS